MSDYYCLPTNIGLAKLSAFATGGTPITLTHFAVGDANGTPYLPETRVSANTLVHERHRATIESVLESPFDNTVSIATLNLPANVGGWRICEIALIDADGDIIYLANYPNNYKPTLAEGAGGELEIPVYLQSSAAGSIAVVVDPNVLSASQNWVSSNFALKTELQAETDSRNTALTALMQRLTANGIDADLAITNNATGSDFNDAQFKQTGIWYFDHALNTSEENTAGIIRSHKAGNKVYQHEILETGREGNRVFNGTTWLPWVFQTVGTPPPNTVPLVPISSYADLNNFNTAGNFSFSASDNILHAPPTQGSEADYELQVLVTPNSGIIQIVKNITTNTGFVRVKGSGNWNNQWVLTPPIEHIITNANIDGIRSEGVYLCTKDTNDDLPETFFNNSVFILYVKNSSANQTVVQVIKKITGDYSSYVPPIFHEYMPNSTIHYRTVIDTGLNYNQFEIWRSLCLLPSGPYGSFNPYDSDQQVLDYYFTLSAYMLRYINLNQLFSKGLYIFTLNDNISNVPPTFTEDNGFCFLFTVVIDPNSGVAGDDEVTQFIYQYNGVNTGSGLYTRTAPLVDWQSNVPLPDWTLVP